MAPSINQTLLWHVSRGCLHLGHLIPCYLGQLAENSLDTKVVVFPDLIKCFKYPLIHSQCYLLPTLGFTELLCQGIVDNIGKRITGEGSVPEMLIWSVLLIKSDSE